MYVDTFEDIQTSLDNQYWAKQKLSIFEKKILDFIIVFHPSVLTLIGMSYESKK
jgi:hypothetical protein